MLNPDAKMTNSINLLCQLYLSRSVLGKAKLSCRKSLAIRSLLTVGWLAGFTVVLFGCSSSSVSDSPTPVPTTGESITSEEVQNYATAVLAIEQSRQAAYTEIQQLTNEEQVPDFICTQADTISELPASVRDIAVNYCNQAKKIVSDRLTIAKFNTITASAQAEPDLLRRIQNELVRLQR
jgi:hypothetical protein